MRIYILTVGLGISTLASVVYSQEKPAAKPAMGAGKPSPCNAVMSACRAAGYTQGGHKDGKGIHADCVGKLFRGETVAGVSVTKEQIKECQDRHNQIDAGAQMKVNPHGKLPVTSPAP